MMDALRHTIRPKVSSTMWFRPKGLAVCLSARASGVYVKLFYQDSNLIRSDFMIPRFGSPTQTQHTDSFVCVRKAQDLKRIRDHRFRLF
jgi:hypothetical protein